MMAVYLLPYPVRGVHAPYLWVFYKFLSLLQERALFMVGEDYLADPACFAAEGRWELTPLTQSTYGYSTPPPLTLARHQIETLPASLFATLLADCRGNPIEVFRRILTRRLPALEAAFEAALDKSGDTIEAIVTWHNCPSLSAVAMRRGCPVIHLEVGPLRAPLYRPTAYLDFSGVNGNTEAESRYLKMPRCVGEHFSVESLRRFFFLPGELPAKTPVSHVGVALQVEDDSNLVAFGNGYDNQATLVYARLNHIGDGPLLVRRHPGSLFRVVGDWFITDASYDSKEFIQHCRHIVTVNSSLGLEAILSGTPITVLGDSSYRFILAGGDENERVARLAFYLFAYLIPESLMFDLDYLRFRIQAPDEGVVVARHAAAYLGRQFRPDTISGEQGDSVWSQVKTILNGA